LGLQLVLSAYDEFYGIVYELLNYFYPKQTITVTSRDPTYITPAVKSKLRRKNRLMHKGRIEEASALAKRIGEDINRKCQTRLAKLDGRVDAKGMWAAVRQFTGRQKETVAVSGVTADSFNQHYANISTDSMYADPLPKHSANPANTDFFSEWSVFQMLDKLHSAATGMDDLPAWFLRLGAADPWTILADILSSHLYVCMYVCGFISRNPYSLSSHEARP